MHDPKECNVNRSTRKADLMPKGYVNNEAELDKSFSEREVMETLVGLSALSLMTLLKNGLCHKEIGMRGANHMHSSFNGCD